MIINGKVSVRLFFAIRSSIWAGKSTTLGILHSITLETYGYAQLLLATAVGFFFKEPVQSRVATIEAVSF